MIWYLLYPIRGYVQLLSFRPICFPRTDGMLLALPQLPISSPRTLSVSPSPATLAPQLGMS